jgi:protein TonB
VTRPPLSRGGRLPALPAFASVLLHGGAILGLFALARADRLPEAGQEQGVEIVWQDTPQDAAPGEEAAAVPEAAQAAPEQAAETPPPETPPPEPQQVRSEPPPEPPPEPPAPEPPAIQPPQPEPPQAEAPPPPLPEEPPPAAQAELPPPPAEPPPPPRPAPRPQASTQMAAARQAPPAALPAGPPAAAPSAPSAPGGSRATGAVSPPGLLDGVRNPEPEYPLANRQRGEQGVVTVVLRVSEGGQVTEVEVVATSGFPALDDSARKAVQRWRFRPATRDGVPVAGSIRTAIHFRLR